MFGSGPASGQPQSKIVRAYGRQKFRVHLPDPEEQARLAYANAKPRTNSSFTDDSDVFGAPPLPPPPTRQAGYRPTAVTAMPAAAESVNPVGRVPGKQPAATIARPKPKPHAAPMSPPQSKPATAHARPEFRVPSTPASRPHVLPSTPQVQHRTPILTPSHSLADMETPQSQHCTPAPAPSHSLSGMETPLDHVERRVSFMSINTSSDSPSRSRHDSFEPLANDLSHITPIRPASSASSFDPFTPIPTRPSFAHFTPTPARFSFAPDSPSPSPQTQQPTQSPLTQLLAQCTTPTVLRFADMFAHHGWTASNLTKIGEASYSDVFMIDNIVIKIMPFANPNTRSRPSSDRRMSALMLRHTRRQSLAHSNTSIFFDHSSTSMLVAADVDELRPLAALIHELKLSLTVSPLPGFIPTLAAHVVHDEYTPAMLAAWHAFTSTHPHDALNPPPPTSAPQWYCAVVMPYAGTPLDKVALTKAKDVREVLVQVAEALAVGEREVGFEHRDLHWGNVLVGEGCEVKLIDWTLSRVAGVWSRVPEDVFEGEGDAQFDVYRAMREVVEAEGAGEWGRYYPRTNVLWLEYLVEKLSKKSRSEVFRKAMKQLALDLEACGSAEEAVEVVKRLPVIRSK